MGKLALQQKAAVTTRVRNLVNSRIEKKLELQRLEGELKELDESIKAETVKAGGELDTDDWTVKLIESCSRHIKKELLLELGVKPTIIAKATEEKPYSYPKVTVKNK